LSCALAIAISPSSPVVNLIIVLLLLPYALVIARHSRCVNHYLNWTLTKSPAGLNMVQTLRPTVLTVVRVCHHVSASASVSTNTVFHSHAPVGFSAGGLENCVLTCHIWFTTCFVQTIPPASTPQSRCPHGLSAL
jgi:hypothetical protein